MGSWTGDVLAPGPGTLVLGPGSLVTASGALVQGHGTLGGAVVEPGLWRGPMPL